jgi:uncharacterized protein (DUF2147 family)
MRSRIFLVMAIAAALSGATAVQAAKPGWAAASVQAAEPTAAGLWEQSDGRGHVGAWFFIFPQDGVYFGAMVKMFPKPGQDPNPICTACSGDEKNQPSLGLLMIKGMQRNGRFYQNGTILDPRNGSVYNATLEVTEDGQKLKLRGFVGIPLFGSTQVWKRLPDDALSPSEVPENLAQYWPVAPNKPDKTKARVPHPPAKP